MKTFSVRMPDGRMVRGIPEGTTKAQLIEKYMKKYPTAKLDELNLDKDDDDNEPYRNPMSNKVGNLTEDETEQLLEIVGKRESSNNYRAENRLGYIGKYQFGAAALVDAGLVKRGAYDKWKSGGRPGGQKGFLADDENWLFEGGKNAWMGDRASQDEAMRSLLEENLKRLTRKKAITKKTTPQDTAGYLMAAHLGGWANAAKLAKEGADFKDANGTSINEYYKLGQGVVEVQESPKEAPVKEPEQAALPEEGFNVAQLMMEKLDDGTYQDENGNLFSVSGGKVSPYDA